MRSATSTQATIFIWSSKRFVEGSARTGIEDQRTPPEGTRTKERGGGKPALVEVSDEDLQDKDDDQQCFFYHS